jgi:hypothetical protein
LGGSRDIADWWSQGCCWNSLLWNCRLTLLLGPPSSGKTTLLLALAGKLDKDLRVRLNILIQISLFLPQDQQDGKFYSKSVVFCDQKLLRSFQWAGSWKSFQDHFMKFTSLIFLNPILWVNSCWWHWIAGQWEDHVQWTYTRRICARENGSVH